jgi:hypothetical protein
MLGHRFAEFFRLCSLVWNIHGQEALFVREDIIDCFRDAIQSEGHMTKVVAFTVPLGPLEAALYVRMCLKMACDLILIFQQLFWTSTSTKFLRENDLRRVLVSYKTGQLRTTMHHLIDGSLAAFDIVAALDLHQVMGILTETVQTGARALREEQDLLRKAKQRGSDTIVEKKGMPLAELA